MTPSLTPQYSRRFVCVGGAASVGAALLPFTLAAREAEQGMIANGSPLHIRGVRPGAHAVLRTQGTVIAQTAQSSAQRVWHFQENTTVSWVQSALGQMIEQRSGRIQLSPVHGGRIIEIATGPVDEALVADERLATIATTRAGVSLIVTPGTLAPSDVWQIADDPLTAPLPAGLSEFRVFRAIGDDAARHVVWALCSPWLSALGDAPSGTRLLWRGQGQLAAWRQSDGADFI